MTLIESLEKQIADLDAKITPLTDEHARLRQQLIEAKSKFKIGDIITWNKGTRKGRVVSIFNWCCDEAAWQVRRIKNDGTEGEYEKVYYWKHPELL